MGFDRARDARCIGTWLAMLLFSTRAVAAGEQNRWYTQFRFGESMPFSRAHDAVGLTVGRHLTEHLGLELAADFYEVFVDQPGVGRIGEDTRYGGNFDSLFVTIGLRVYLFGA